MGYRNLMVRSAETMRLDLWNNSNILWGILLPSVIDGQSEISLNCYWSEVQVSLCLCECIHTHVACIHIYYKKHKSSTFQCAEHQILPNISILKSSGENITHVSNLQKLCYNTNLENLQEKSESFICFKKV